MADADPMSIIQSQIIKLCAEDSVSSRAKWSIFPNIEVDLSLLKYFALFFSVLKFQAFNALLEVLKQKKE